MGELAVHINNLQRTRTIHTQTRAPVKANHSYSAVCWMLLNEWAECWMVCLFECELFLYVVSYKHINLIFYTHRINEHTQLISACFLVTMFGWRDNKLLNLSSTSNTVGRHNTNRRRVCTCGIIFHEHYISTRPSHESNSELSITIPIHYWEVL